MIAALAGRRIDAPDAPTEQFPPRFRERVLTRIDEAFAACGITTLVSAAACGADLLALAAARRRGIAIRIVLPFGIADYRRISVVDRGSEWGETFDRLVGESAAHGDVHVLGLDVADERAFALTNAALLDDAFALADGSALDVLAFAVWDGPRGEAPDYTASFAAAAEARGVPVRSIPILFEPSSTGHRVS